MKIVWDKSGTRQFEAGVSKGVLYPMSDVPGTYANGVAWNGLISVTESPSGAEPSAVYADNIKYLNMLSQEEFEATIEAYTYPQEFGVCDGSEEVEKGMIVTQQPRKQFAICYQTKIGNDINPDAGFKLHIVYGALAGPSERAYETVNESPEGITFSWEITTTPVEITGFKPSAHIEIDSTKADAVKLATLLDTLYGKDGAEGADTKPTLLFPDEIAAILKTV